VQVDERVAQRRRRGPEILQRRAHPAHDHLERVDRLDGRGGVVDSRRQRPDRRVHDDADRELGVLLDGSLLGHADGAAQEGAIGLGASVYAHQRLASGHELADAGNRTAAPTSSTRAVTTVTS
jgi:hypothetical protein